MSVFGEVGRGCEDVGLHVFVYLIGNDVDFVEDRSERTI